MIFKGFLAIEKFSHFSLYQPLSLTHTPLSIPSPIRFCLNDSNFLLLSSNEAFL